MPVAFDAGDEAVITGTTSLTVPFTCTGVDRVLYAAVSWEPGGGGVDAVTATYNSVAMDIFFTDIASHASRHVRVFRLVAPDTGEHDLVFSWSGNQAYAFIIASFTGVDQADPDEAHVVTSGAAGVTSINGEIASAGDGMVMDIFITNTGITGLAIGGNQTLIGSSFGTDPPSLGIAGSYRTGDSVTDMDWTWNETTAAMHWGWSINASGSGGGGENLPAIRYFYAQQQG